ncbi:hypothetical protein KM176_04650 [Pseudooceanicola sp. CBS1P-1]|uniref:Uncharacterized protein n=1 Tax=Pseudooceanicola albus TaxID=2692189 RepID=A0A6L7G6X6_9RHOB|nr:MULTISPECIES: hypothetical protein [Pseudooceanicola]MBT9383139.1 hypothetical protein [Pseudooceanicola endophyticus]MXN19327.1 hypothetical protein [Pseudooceanicola albus]
MTPDRAWVIIDNDLSGDPGDLFRTALHLMSPSVAIPLIVGSHLPKGGGVDPSGYHAGNAAGRVQPLLTVMG